MDIDVDNCNTHAALGCDSARCVKRNFIGFIAGADINEFVALSTTGAGRALSSSGHQLVDRIDTLANGEDVILDYKTGMHRKFLGSDGRPMNSEHRVGRAVATLLTAGLFEVLMVPTAAMERTGCFRRASTMA